MQCGLSASLWQQVPSNGRMHHFKAGLCIQSAVQNLFAALACMAKIRQKPLCGNLLLINLFAARAEQPT